MTPAGLVLAMMLVIGSALPATAQQVIDRVRITPGESETEINVGFTTPFTYLSHAPRTRGDTLVIDLRSVLGAGGNPIQTLINESKQINRREGVPLTGVRFEGESAAGQRLILEFDRAVDFRVTGTPDGQGVTIVLPSDTLPQHADVGKAVPPVPSPKADIAIPEPRASADSPTSTGSQGTGSQGTGTRPTAEATLPALSDERLEQTWQEAKKAVTERDFERAIKLYTKLLQLPPHKYTQQSQEFLGLARERNGQLAHAKSEYEAYLGLYPEGDDSDRVRQRLAAILTSRAEPKAELRSAEGETDEEEESFWANWDILQYGGISEFYVFRRNISEDIGSETIQNDFFTDADYTIRATNDRFDLRALFVGGHTLSFVEDQDTSEFSVSSLDIDVLDQELGLSARIGRQRQNNSGILGRFDGAFFGYQVAPKVKINVFGGFPVDRRSDGLETDRYFTGGSVEFAPFADAWSFTVFGLNQVADDVDDRRAIGGSATYASNQFFAFGLVDHDILSNELNLGLLNGTFIFEGGSTLNAALDYRNSPILTTTNALQGQNANSLSELRDRFSEDELRDLALDRTARSQSLTLGGSHPLNEQFQILGDVTVTKFGATEASGGVEASPATGYDTFYSGQLVATNLLTQNDITILGLRFADTDRGKTISNDVNFRYSLNRQWRLNPRLRTDYRFDEDDGGSRFRIRPSMAVDYRFIKRGNVELEVGGEWASEEFIDDIDQDGEDDEEIIDSGDFFVTLGARFDF